MARGGSRGRRNYTRDNSGRFSSTPGGGPARSTPASRRAAKPKRGALKPNGGTLTARARLKASRAKLTPGASRQQRAAVTRAQNRLKAAQAPVRMKTTTAGVKARIAKPRGMKRDPQAAAKLAALQQGRRGRQPNAKAQQAKAMANRTGVVKGKLRTDGQDTRTLSLAEMRRAVRQTLRKGGIETRKQFEKAYGKPPTTRGGWERLYKENVSMPQADRNRRGRPGVINGIDIQKNFRPWAVFGLNPRTATRQDVQAAFRQLAKQNHPDVGGRRKDFERLQKMRDSMLAFMPAPKGSKPSKGGKRGKASATAPAAPRGPLLLPPARDATPAKPARKRGATAGTGGKGAAAKTKAPAGPRVTSRDWTSLGRLRGAVPFDNGRGRTGLFVPASSLTPAKRKKLGLGAFKTQVDGANFAAQRHTQGSQEGWIISPRTSRGETAVQLQRSKSSRKPKTADDLLTQATRIEAMGRRMSRAARTGARDRQIEARAVRAARAARQRAFDMQKPPSKAELKRQEQRLRSRTTRGLNARLARDYAARNRR